MTVGVLHWRKRTSYNSVKYSDCHESTSLNCSVTTSFHSISNSLLNVILTSKAINSSFLSVLFITATSWGLYDRRAELRFSWGEEMSIFSVTLRSVGGYRSGVWGLLFGQRDGRSLKLNIHLRIAHNLKMHGTRPPLPLRLNETPC
jgi:hypothetical protein